MLDCVTTFAKDEKLDSIYRTIHSSSLPLVASNSIKIEPLPVEGEMRWGASIVLRGKLPESVKSIIQELRSILGTNHTYYGTDSWHISIRSLEPFRQKIPETDQAIAIYKRIVDSHLSFAQFNVGFQGLVTTASGLLLCGYPDFDLEKLRLSIFQELSSHGLVSNSPEPAIDRLRDTCHASLVVFGSKIDRNSEYIDYVESKLAETFGSAQNLDLELVRYIRTENQINVVRLS